VIDLGRDGDVWILRMTAGENRFTQDWLDAVRAALDQVEAAPGPAAVLHQRPGSGLAGRPRRRGRPVPGQPDPAAWPAGHVPGADGGRGQRARVRGGRGAGGRARFPGHAGRPGLLVPARGRPGPAAHPGAVRGGRGQAARARRQEAILTGRRYGGAAAAAAGIAHQAVPEDQVLARAVELAAGLAGKDRRTLAEHKRLLFGAAAQACGA
jgi:Delta3-Delta2-enoyl-CoA isomerase